MGRIRTGINLRLQLRWPLPTQFDPLRTGTVKHSESPSYLPRHRAFVIQRSDVVTRVNSDRVERAPTPDKTVTPRDAL